MVSVYKYSSPFGTLFFLFYDWNWSHFVGTLLLGPHHLSDPVCLMVDNSTHETNILIKSQALGGKEITVKTHVVSLEW